MQFKNLSEKLNKFKETNLKIKEKMKTSLNNSFLGSKPSLAFFGHIQKYALYYITLLIFIIFIAITNGLLINSSIFASMIQNNAYLFVAAIGTLLVILVGHIDLSSGSLIFFGAYLTLKLNQEASGMNVILILLIVSISGFAIGSLFGFLVSYFKIPSFIVTLGGLLFFRGLISNTIIKKENGTMSVPFDSSLYSLMNSRISLSKDAQQADILSIVILCLFLLGFLAFFSYTLYRKMKIQRGAKLVLISVAKMIAVSLGVGILLFLYYKGLPYFILLILILAGIFTVILSLTVYGRSIYAVGGNFKAAQLSGINSKRIVLLSFAFSSALAMIGGIMMASNLGVNGTTAEGDELNVISSVFVGGASNSGGIGTVSGTAIGWFLLSIINQTFSILSVGRQISDVIKSVVLVGAVGYDIFSRRRSI